ncbi:MAG: phosphotransferase [Candidatus Latescibacteria bacterium]|nr:phosphotransferase [bacterium]MBD3424661.1 phosphotransferase [Candidatus Latescibacterota bacterium]
MNMNIAELVAHALDLTAEIPGGSLKPNARAVPFTAGGSGRYFLRLSDGDRSVVSLIEPSNTEELKRYYSIGTFLKDNGIGVPEIYLFDRKKGILLMEDLGDTTLEKMWIRGNGVISIYRMCLDLLCRMQVAVTGKIGLEASPHLERFGRDQFLEETDYFEREFMQRFKPDISPSDWERERAKLADELSAEPAVFMHRDYQSRNIIISCNEPRLIDFQTSYQGPSFYDAASLLKDPYVSLPEKTESTLLEHYYRKLSAEGGDNGYRFADFRHLYTTAGIQRNLQALAAYAKLGFGDGKTRFLRSIHPALMLLERGARENGSYPGIRKMALSFLNEISESDLIRDN